MNHGSRNLIILGVVALVLTFLTTGVSLWIYKQTGDIYLDRSRPGYMPDEAEAEEEAEYETDFVYSEEGPIDVKNLNEYIKEYKKVMDQLDKLKNPYSEAPLTDKALGIE